MGNWSVDPAGVAGILAATDAQGLEIETDQLALDGVVADGESVLVVDGRTVLSSAWNAFFSRRGRVPGQLIHVIVARGSAVATATAAVTFGDETMAAEWGIGPEFTYAVVQ